MTNSEVTAADSCVAAGLGNAGLSAAHTIRIGSGSAGEKRAKPTHSLRAVTYRLRNPGAGP